MTPTEGLTTGRSIAQLASSRPPPLQSNAFQPSADSTSNLGSVVKERDTLHESLKYFFIESKCKGKHCCCAGIGDLPPKIAPDLLCLVLYTPHGTHLLRRLYHTVVRCLWSVNLIKMMTHGLFTLWSFLYVARAIFLDIG